MVSVYPTMYTLLSNPSYMKSRSLRSFTSVVLCFTPKNVLFWALEEITWPGAWDHDRLGDRFLGLTFRLWVYLDEGYLPQYFCPGGQPSRGLYGSAAGLCYTKHKRVPVKPTELPGSELDTSDYSTRIPQLTSHTTATPLHVWHAL